MNKKKIMISTTIVAISTIIIVIMIFLNNNKLPEATIKDFNNIKKVIKNEIQEEYFQVDIQKYTFEYQAYSYLNSKDEDIMIENLSTEEKMSMLAYKLFLNSTNDNNKLEIIRDYKNESEKQIDYTNSKTYVISSLSISRKNFNELYKKEYNEEIDEKIKTFNIMYDGSCDNIIIHYIDDIDTYVYYMDASINAKSCEITGGELTAYKFERNNLSLYESRNGKTIGEYIYEKKDNEYIFKGRKKVKEVNENIEKVNFGKIAKELEVSAISAYINESSKTENKEFNAGNNVCLSIDWLVNRGYYKNILNLKGSILFEINNNEMHIKSWLNNGKYSLQTIDNSGYNKITQQNIKTTINCNGKELKNVVYCDLDCKYIK